MGKASSKRKNKEINSATDTDTEYKTSRYLRANYRDLSEFYMDSYSEASGLSSEEYSMPRDRPNGTFPESFDYYFYNGHFGYPVNISQTANAVPAEKRSLKDCRPKKTDTALDYCNYTSNRQVERGTMYYNTPLFHIQSRELDNSLWKTSTLASNSCDKADAMPDSNTGQLPLLWISSDIPSPSSSIKSGTYVNLADISRDTPSNYSRLFDPGRQAMDWRPEDPESSADSLTSTTDLKQAYLQGFRQNVTDDEYSDTSFRLSDSTVENEKESSLSVEYMVEAFKETIAVTVKVEEILPYLTVLGIDDADFDYGKSSKDAVFHLISKIQSSDVDGKWQAFLDALNQAEYQYIADLLQCKTEKDHTIARELLKLRTPVLAKNIDPDYFVNRLFEEKVITQQDMEEIKREKDRRGETAASMMLLQKIPRLATNWVRIFRDVLRESGMVTVAEDFDSDASSNCKNKGMLIRGRPLPRLPTSVPWTQTQPKLLEHATRSSSTDYGRSSRMLTERPLPRLPTSEPKIPEHAARSHSTESSRSSSELTDDGRDTTETDDYSTLCADDTFETTDSDLDGSRYARPSFANRGRPLSRLPACQTELLERATRSAYTDSGRSSTELTDDDRDTTETDDYSTLCADDTIETTDSDLDGSRYARPSFPNRGGNASSANSYASVVYPAKKKRQKYSYKGEKRIKKEIMKELRTEVAQGFAELKDHVTDTVSNALVCSSVPRFNVPEPTYVYTDDYTADYCFRPVPIYSTIQRPKSMPDFYGSNALLW